jgi:hypothetical protein
VHIIASPAGFLKKQINAIKWFKGYQSVIPYIDEHRRGLNQSTNAKIGIFGNVWLSRCKINLYRNRKDKRDKYIR